MEIEDKVELAHISEVFVEDLYKWLHELEYNQLVLVLIDNSYEVERCETLVDDFELFVIEEIAHFGAACNDHLVDLA